MGSSSKDNVSIVAFVSLDILTCNVDMDEIYIFEANGVKVYVVVACGRLPS